MVLMELGLYCTESSVDEYTDLAAQIGCNVSP
jgi:hypothetical protein